MPTRQQLLEQDARELARLGYAQQLFREMGGFSNFAISFSIISVLTGAVLLYGYGLKLAGPVINTVGWPVVSLLTLCVAASMAELASAYPTAGGLYFWAFRLGGRGWAWLTAWLNMIGQVTITAGINVAGATYLNGDATRIRGSRRRPRRTRPRHRRLQGAVAALRAHPGPAVPLCRGAARAGLRARPATGAVDVHRLRRLRARRRGDGHGAPQFRVGRVPLGRRLCHRRLRVAARAHVVDSEGRYRRHR